MKEAQLNEIEYTLIMNLKNLELKDEEELIKMFLVLINKVYQRE